MKYEELQQKANSSSEQFHLFMEEDNLGEAIQEVLHRGMYLSRMVAQLDLHDKCNSIIEIANSTNELAKSYKSFGPNLNTLLLAAQSGSGMLGLVGFSDTMSYRLFNNMDLKERITILNSFSHGFGQACSSFKGLVDDGTQSHRTVLQHQLEILRKQNDDKKTNMQQIQTLTAEMINQLKQLNQIRHEGKSLMARAGG